MFFQTTSKGDIAELGEHAAATVDPIASSTAFLTARSSFPASLPLPPLLPPPHSELIVSASSFYQFCPQNEGFVSTKISISAMKRMVKNP